MNFWKGYILMMLETFGRGVIGLLIFSLDNFKTGQFGDLVFILAHMWFVWIALPGIRFFIEHYEGAEE